MKTKLLICVLIVLGIPTGFLAEEAQARDFNLKNAVILVIRHAEEPAHGYELSSTGVARAKAYVDYFKAFAVDGQPIKLNFLFAARDTTRSHRPRLTLEPTAQAFDLNVDSSFKTDQYSELVHEIEGLPSGGNILICWRHKQIPELLRTLGADSRNLLPKGKWPGDVFGWLILLRYDDKGHLFESKVINENLMPDDSGKTLLAPSLIKFVAMP